MVNCQFLSLLKICQTTRVKLGSPSLSLTTGSFHSRTTCTSSFLSFTNEISLSFRVRLKNKSVREGRIHSKHSTNHMLRRISYSKAIGSRISQSLTGWTSPQCCDRRDYVNGKYESWITWTRNMSHGLREREIWVNGFQKERFVHERNITRDNPDEENQQWCSSSETRFLQSKSFRATL